MPPPQAEPSIVTPDLAGEMISGPCRAHERALAKRPSSGKSRYQDATGQAAKSPPSPPRSPRKRNHHFRGGAPKMVEARGVEPLSLERLAQVTTCLGCRRSEVGSQDSHLDPTRAPTKRSRLATRSPRRPAKPAVHAPTPSRRQRRDVAVNQAARASSSVLAVVFVDPMINEANGSSSACRLRRVSQVETSTPPEPARL